MIKRRTMRHGEIATRREGRRSASEREYVMSDCGGFSTIRSPLSGAGATGPRRHLSRLGPPAKTFIKTCLRIGSRMTWPILLGRQIGAGFVSCCGPVSSARQEMNWGPRHRHRTVIRMRYEHGCGRPGAMHVHLIFAAIRCDRSKSLFVC